MMNTTELNDEMLWKVNGGTFNRNKYSTETYRSAGIEVVDHFFEADEFILENGEHITHDEANAIVRAMRGEDESSNSLVTRKVHFVR